MKRWSVRIGAYLAPQVGSLAQILVLVLMGAGLEALKPWPLKLLVDHVVVSEPLPAPVAWMAFLPSAGSPRGLIAWLTAMTVFLFLTSAAVRMVRAYIQAGAGTQMMYRLGADLFDHLQRLSLRFHARQRTGDLVQRVVGDAGCARDLVLRVLLPLLTSAATLLVMFGVMWRMDWLLTGIALGVVPFLLIAIRLFAKDMEDRSYEYAELQGEMMGTAEETLTAIPVVQAFGREPHEDRRFGKLTDRTGRAYVRTAVSQLWFKTSTSSTMAIGTVMIVLVGGLHVLDGRLSVGSLLVFLSYLASLYAPLETMAYLSSGYAGAAAGARRVLHVMDTHDHVVEGHGTRTVRTSQPPGIVFDDVTFGYEPGVAVLKNISLNITGGETLGPRRDDGVWQEHPRISGAPAIRLLERTDSRRRNGHPRPAPRGSSWADRNRPAGTISVSADHRGEHRVRPARGNAGGSD